MAAEELQDIVKWTNVFHQYCATVAGIRILTSKFLTVLYFEFAVNLIAISHGCVIGKNALVKVPTKYP